MFLLAQLFGLALPLSVPAQDAPDGGMSGGPLRPGQACYDVQHYNLSLRVDPGRRRIDGIVAMAATVVEPSEVFELDLHDLLTVKTVRSGEQELAFRHEEGVLRIEAGDLLSREGEVFGIAVEYGGEPREAVRPPWDGGFTWAAAADGSPWIATSCQGEGADLWWPCKDHPSDEPESMLINITVPEPLVVASNGRLDSVSAADEGWHTYHWSVNTPINNYGVALNIARYETVSVDYTSVAGESMPITYWVLPENVEQGKVLVEDIRGQIAFFEKIFGPYPFRADKYGAVETPHLGMEHQTIIAYGNKYSGNPWGKDWGFDFLHYHEAAHEWWANLVTCRDWKDFWIHESFATYSQSLYVEEREGFEGYLYEIHNLGTGMNRHPIAARESKATGEMYFAGTGPGNDIYYKGAVVLHTLRWVMGDESFFAALRRMAYPDPELEAATDGSACRFTDTDEIRSIAEAHHGSSLEWFFDAYLYEAALPVLQAEERDGILHLAWDAPGGGAFPMPVPVRVGEEVVRAEVPAGGAVIELGGEDWEVDPDGRILREDMTRRLARRRSR